MVCSACGGFLPGEAAASSTSSCRCPNHAQLSRELLQAATVVSLKEILKTRGLPSSGHKADLIDRLLVKPAEALNTAPTVNTTDEESIEKLNTFKQRKANQRTLRSTTVKCMLKCRLREPEVMLHFILIFWCNKVTTFYLFA